MARKSTPAPKQGTQGIFILPSIYNETLMLLAEAHDYFYRYGEQDQALMNPRERTMYASEMSRITIRLSAIMAWLITRRAVFTGKAPDNEAVLHYRLDCRDVCMHQHIQAEAILPKRMTDLLDKTFELYQRVARLDDALEAQSPTPVSS